MNYLQEKKKQSNRLRKKNVVFWFIHFDVELGDTGDCWTIP
jgi:hypothetical protein